MKIINVIPVGGGGAFSDNTYQQTRCRYTIGTMYGSVKFTKDCLRSANMYLHPL